jgi:hypothetical protein
VEDFQGNGKTEGRNDVRPGVIGKSACKPGFVVDNHSSGLEVTFQPQATNPKTARTTP